MKTIHTEELTETVEVVEEADEEQAIEEEVSLFSHQIYISTF